MTNWITEDGIGLVGRLASGQQRRVRPVVRGGLTRAGSVVWIIGTHGIGHSNVVDRPLSIRNANAGHYPALYDDRVVAADAVARSGARCVPRGRYLCALATMRDLPRRFADRPQRPVQFLRHLHGAPAGADRFTKSVPAGSTEPGRGDDADQD